MIKFTGDISEILEGAKILFGERTEDLTINIKKEGTGLKIDKVGDNITICYGKKCEFFRAMVLLLEDYKGRDEMHIHQTPKFKTIGIMPQCTGGSLTVDSIKEIIKYMRRNRGLDNLLDDLATQFLMLDFRRMLRGRSNRPMEFYRIFARR